MEFWNSFNMQLKNIVNIINEPSNKIIKDFRFLKKVYVG
jgi:hypothetical protein